MTKNHTAMAAATRTKTITTTIPAILGPVKKLDDFDDSDVLFGEETGRFFGGGGAVYGGGGGAEWLS